MSVASRPWQPLQRTFAASIVLLAALHLVQLLWAPRLVVVSRMGTAGMAVLAALTIAWRVERVRRWERGPWLWLAAALLLWASGHAMEAKLGSSLSASNLAADPADFAYLLTPFALLMAISNSSETEMVPGTDLVNLLQAAVSAGLIYVRLFQVSGPSSMLQIYAVECLLLAIFALVRLPGCSSREEQRRTQAMGLVVWVYLPIEIGMDFASAHWRLQAGTPLDLLWSVPFALAAWRVLAMPFDTGPTGEEDSSRTKVRRSLLLQSLCPLMITMAAFLLASTLLASHTRLAVSAMLVLLGLQGAHSALVQSSFLHSRELLRDHHSELMQANAGLERLSLLDPLTGVANRRQFTEALEMEWKRAHLRQVNLALLMVDVDHFKRVNDDYGHSRGDEYLVQIARMLREQLRRGNDLLARYGGEEFVILLPETDTASAVALGRRMQAAIAEVRMVNAGSPFGVVTLSIGVCACTPGPGMTAEHMTTLADQALYDAKKTGRNRICTRDYRSEHEQSLLAAGADESHDAVFNAHS